MATLSAAKKWRRRPVLARVVAAVPFVVPVILATAAAIAVRAAFGGRGTFVTVAVLLLMVAVAAVTFRLAERVCRRVMPLSLLLGMSLAFPDHAPSRLGVALRAGSSKALLRDPADP